MKLKVNPQLDWGEFAGIEELQELMKPRIDRAAVLASEWERRLLLDALRLGCWRIWFIQWCEFTETAAFMNTKVFPAWGFKEAQKLARSLGENLIGLNLKRWLLMSEQQFLCESGSSPNRDVMMEIRRVLGARSTTHRLKAVSL